MPSITLKNLPPKLHRTLKARARAHHRSLNKEVVATLAAATDASTPVDTEALQREARHARTKFKRVMTAKELRSWTRQGRM
jgi:plasmid stability protein